MKTLEIKKETLPNRCEICHKQDYFDAVNNYCNRCSNLPMKELVKNDKNNVNIGIKLQTVSDYSLDLILLIKIILTPFFLAFFLILWVNLFSEYGIWYIQNDLLGLLSVVPFLVFPIWLIFFAPKPFGKVFG
jgi:hypothetical protein